MFFWMKTIKQAMHTTFHANHLSTASSSLYIAPRSSREAPGPHAFPNLFNKYLAVTQHHGFMASCMLWHSSFCSVQSCDIYFWFELTHVPFIYSSFLMKFWHIQYGFFAQNSNSAWTHPMWCAEQGIHLHFRLLCSFLINSLAKSVGYLSIISTGKKLVTGPQPAVCYQRTLPAI